MSDYFLTAWTVAYQAPQSMGFPRQEYWNGLPFPPPDLSYPGIEPESPMSPALAGRFFPTESLRKPFFMLLLSHFSRVRLCVTHRQQPTRLPVPGILQARTLEWGAIAFSNA